MIVRFRHHNYIESIVKFSLGVINNSELAMEYVFLCLCVDEMLYPFLQKFVQHQAILYSHFSFNNYLCSSVNLKAQIMSKGPVSKMGYQRIACKN